MKSLEQLWCFLAEELGTLCGVDASRDTVYVSRRCEKEGDAFLRITLPAFSKAFDTALEEGRVSSGLFVGFQRRGGLPLFLRGFLRNIFTPDGRMLDIPCVESIRAVRQLAALCGKIQGDCTLVRDRKAVEEYVKADDGCAQWDALSSPALLKELESVSRLALGWVLSPADYAVSQDRLEPKHGPGATADGLRGNAKFDMDYWPDHLDSRFPWDEWAIANPRFSEDGPNRQIPFRPAKMSLVPKTMSKPRVIVEEPTAVQYMQQGLLRVMTESIESQTTQVGFSDQGQNREMARWSSRSRRLATLDLSEASDRVTLQQARSSFSALPNLLEALLATRSDRVRLPNGLVRPVHKFASMGSATCFPVEACVFWVAILMAIRRHHRKEVSSFELTFRFLKSLEGKVRVYGDDILVPVRYLSEVYELFEELGWKINAGKSFSKSHFRESCGGDYWRGHDVTPVRVKDTIPSNFRQPEKVHSLVEFRNQLYLAGYWKTAGMIDNHLRALLNGVFPIANTEVNGLVRESCCFTGFTRATDTLHRHLTKAWVLNSPLPVNSASEHGSLIKCLTLHSLEGDHLHRSGRPLVVYKKLRWVPIGSTDGTWYGSKDML